MAECSVCLRAISTTFTRVIRSHGPTTNGCRGSGRPPRQSSQSPQAGSLASASQPPALRSASSQAIDLSASSLSPTAPSDQPRLPPPLLSVPKVNVVKRIPRGSRVLGSSKLATLLEGVVSTNSHDSWVRLLHFAPRCLRVPLRGGRRRSLPSMINRQLREEADPPPARGRTGVTGNLFPPEKLFPRKKFASGNVPRLANLFPSLYNIPDSKRPGKRAGEAL